jgi:hypothetical protein
VRMAPCQILLDAQGKVAWTSSFGSFTEGIGGIRKALESVVATK